MRNMAVEVQTIAVASYMHFTIKIKVDGSLLGNRKHLTVMRGRLVTCQSCWNCQQKRVHHETGAIVCQWLINDCVPAALVLLDDLPFSFLDLDPFWPLIESFQKVRNTHTECGRDLTECQQRWRDAKILDFRVRFR